MTRYSEGYGTEEECVLSDPQGESDADADIEDADYSKSPGRCRESAHGAANVNVWLGRTPLRAKMTAASVTPRIGGICGSVRTGRTAAPSWKKVSHK
ncbi:uncharacterized protein si:ch211-63p21.1 isoform X2 [Syngnathus acus]|uniref:uncharacterized protein si:ch211-63p21.1 isoform X2 n=1 Tax=Syngnathus acus TaxID=161584 RepID=UPI0018860707|nr:uncharacterized protein si:ch211-63p21.1 isoform X2 [Syngnathus acus]